jgi:ankyrin repeat protein
LHYAAHYNAPLEVVEALYHAYPQGALQKNNDNNTPLDLAIADGASPNVVALLQGQSVPPTDDEVLDSAKARCDRMEKELQREMEMHDGMNDDRELVLAMLMDIKEKHPHALYAAGIDPSVVNDMDSLLEQVRYLSMYSSYFCISICAR